jgi:hypothetical protein
MERDKRRRVTILLTLELCFRGNRPFLVSRLVPLPPPQVFSGSEFGRFGCLAYIVMYGTGLREDHISGDIAFAIWQVAYKLIAARISCF